MFFIKNQVIICKMGQKVGCLIVKKSAKEKKESKRKR